HSVQTSLQLTIGRLVLARVGLSARVRLRRQIHRAPVCVVRRRVRQRRDHPVGRAVAAGAKRAAAPRSETERDHQHQDGPSAINQYANSTTKTLLGGSWSTPGPGSASIAYDVEPPTRKPPGVATRRLTERP